MTLLRASVLSLALFFGFAASAAATHHMLTHAKPAAKAALAITGD